MFVGPNYVYLQLQKTGCSHVARVLEQTIGGSESHKHARMPEAWRGGKRMVLGSIRNPWDWYVSLWTYACGTGGDLYDRLTGKLDWRAWLYPARRYPLRTLGSYARYRRIEHGKWREVYADARNPELFRRWLRMILDPALAPELGEDYADSDLAASCGFYTWRWARLFVADFATLFTSGRRTNADVTRYLDAAVAVDAFIRTESMEPDLRRVLAKLGVTDPDRLALVTNTGRTNASERERDPGYYYDPQTRELVATREWYLIERFGYTLDGTLGHEAAG
jgi:hypothetical protein